MAGRSRSFSRLVIWWRTHFCALPLSFPHIAQFAFQKVGRTPSSACLVWIKLNSLATGGSRGTRADQGVCPTCERFGSVNYVAIQCPFRGRRHGEGFVFE